MAEQFDNEMRGVLFRNAKDGNEKRPDYRGSAQVDGRKLKMSAWVRTPKRGGHRFLSISIEHDEDERQAAPTDSATDALTPPPVALEHPEATDESLPF